MIMDPLIDQTAEVVIQSAEFRFESPFQPAREMERQQLAHVKYRMSNIVACRGQRPDNASHFLVVDAEHGLRDVFHTQVNDLRINVAHLVA